MSNIHSNPPSGKERPGTLYRVRWWLLGAAVGAGLAAAVLSDQAPAAHADPGYPQCQTVPWGFLGSQRRTICDSSIINGTWQRARVVWSPAHYVPMTTNCSGTRYVTCNSYGGYYAPYAETDNEVYPVTADTVLPDEPGHLG